jgi:hypothetical protein
MFVPMVREIAMIRILALVMAAVLGGAGCERAASPPLHVDPAVLKAAREKAQREEAEREAVEAKARAVLRPEPSEADRLRDLIAWRNEECDRTGRDSIQDDPEMVQTALARGRLRSSVQNTERVKRSLALIPAAARGDLPELRRLLSQGADPNIDVPRDFTLSPLAWAARCDRVAVVDLLVRAGARVNKPLGWGWGRASYTNSSALIWASRRGAERTANRLLQLGARPMREVVHSEDGDARGETPAEAAPTRALKRRLAG